MTSFSSFGDAGKQYGDLARKLQGNGLTPLQRKVGERARQIASDVASSDLGGNDSFSGWTDKGGDAIPLATKFKPLEDGPGILFMPERWSAGLWTVADQGRKGYAAGDKRRSGQRTRKRDGVTVAKYKTVKRNTGATRGKNTATDAANELERRLPNVIRDGVFKLINDSLR